MASAIDAAVAAATNPSSAVNVVDAGKTGFNGLTSDTFLKLLITQLQNQDPTNPMESDELLAQISQMQALQANIELQSTLKSVSMSQQLASAANMIGKTIKANSGYDEVSGVVESVKVASGKAILTIGEWEVTMDDVTEITDTPAE